MQLHGIIVRFVIIGLENIKTCSKIWKKQFYWIPRTQNISKKEMNSYVNMEIA